MSFIKLFKFACGRLPMSHRRFGKDVGKDSFEIEEGIRFVTEGNAFSGTEFLKYMANERKLVRAFSFEMSRDR